MFFSIILIFLVFLGIRKHFFIKNIDKKDLLPLKKLTLLTNH